MSTRQLPVPERLAILCGGFMSQFGWIFFGFGMIFFWIFVMNSEIIYVFSSRNWQSVKGEIMEIKITSAEVNESDVYEFEYEYQVDGITHPGSSYSAMSDFSVGQEVTIEYHKDNPHQSRIEGMRRAVFGWEVVFVIIFPIVGLVFVLIGFRTNMKSLDLLINGRFTRGKMTAKEPTNTEINDQTVYKYTFEFEGPDGKTYQATGKTHITNLLEDEETERIIYAPQDPAYSTMYDTIPGAPKLNEDGTFQPMQFTGYLTLIIPVISVVIHGGVYLILYVL